MKTIIFTLVLILLCAPLFAGYDYQFDTRMNQHGQFESEIGAKLSRGITNTVFGWTEIFSTPAEWAKPVNRGIVSAVVIGIPYGIVRFVGRTVVGVYEIVTFYAPQGPIMPEFGSDVL